MSPDRSIAVHTVRHRSGGDWWRMTHAAAHPAVAGLASSYCDYEERTTTFVRRRELPSGRATLIVNLGEPIDVALEATNVTGDQRHGFFAGLHDGPAVVTTNGTQRGVEVHLTPLGAHALLGHPMHELSRRVVALEDLFGARGRRLRESLGDSRSSGERFAVLDRFLLALLSSAVMPKPSVAYALDRLQSSRGTVSIGGLADHLGCSRRHLIAGFREQVGLGPKLMARILRFEHAVELSGRSPLLDWSEVSHRCGYYDQAHLIRDFHQFAGVTPGGFARLRLPDGGGLRAEEAAVAAA